MDPIGHWINVGVSVDLELERVALYKNTEYCWCRVIALLAVTKELTKMIRELIATDRLNDGTIDKLYDCLSVVRTERKHVMSEYDKNMTKLIDIQKQQSLSDLISTVL